MPTPQPVTNKTTTAANLLNEAAFLARYANDVPPIVRTGSGDYQMKAHRTVRIEKAENPTADDAATKGFRFVKIIATTGDVDHFRDSMVADGVDLDTAFKKNPVILADHNYMCGAIVGRAFDWSIENGEIIITVGIVPEGYLSFADDIFNLIQFNCLNTVSIGFKPVDFMDDSESGVRYYTKWILLEVSFVAVPANPNATVIHSLNSSQPITKDYIMALKNQTPAAVVPPTTTKQDPPPSDGSVDPNQGEMTPDQLKQMIEEAEAREDQFEEQAGEGWATNWTDDQWKQWLTIRLSYAELCEDLATALGVDVSGGDTDEGDDTTAPAPSKSFTFIKELYKQKFGRELSESNHAHMTKGVKMAYKGIKMVSRKLKEAAPAAPADPNAVPPAGKGVTTTVPLNVELVAIPKADLEALKNSIASLTETVTSLKGDKPKTEPEEVSSDAIRSLFQVTN